MISSNTLKIKDLTKEVEPTLPSSPSSKEPECVCVAAPPEAYARSVGSIPRLRLPTKSIDQWPTYVSLQAIPYASPVGAISLAPTIVNSLPIDQQATWIIPALPGVSSIPAQTSKEGYISQIRDLVKSSGIYALSSLVAPFLTLVLAPFLTHTLSHNDYGALAVLTTVISLASGVTQLGIGPAFFRAYTYDYESPRDQLDVLSTTCLLLVFISVSTSIPVVLAAPWVAQLVLNNSSLADAVRLAGLVVLVQNLTVPGLCWLRAKNRAALYSIVSMLDLLVTAGTTVFLVGVVHMGLDGSLIATGIGYAFIGACTLPFMLVRAGIRLRSDIAWGLLTFGFPHVINLLSGWVLQLSDRYLLGRFGSLSQAASYAVAYSLGGVASAFIIAPFSLAWWSLLYSIAKREDAALVFRLIFRWFSIVLLIATFGLSMFGIALLDMFFPSTYLAASAVIPLVALSNVFNGIFTVVSLGTSLKRKTWYAALLITCSALLNFGLNMFLIPCSGAIGAAVSTLIAYFVLALLAYVVNSRIYPVRFEVGFFSVWLLLGVALYVGSDFLAQPFPLSVSWGIRMSALLLYGGCLLLYGIHPSLQRCGHF